MGSNRLMAGGHVHEVRKRGSEPRSATTVRTKIERTAFSTSRLLDFLSEKELTLQCGYGPRDWPLVVVKEPLDNALDACEEQGIAPEVAVTVDEDGITVADNGIGIAPETVDRMLDFSIRVSSREAYCAPDRGAQGNALKTIVAMPLVLDGEEGRWTSAAAAPSPRSRSAWIGSPRGRSPRWRVL